MYVRWTGLAPAARTTVEDYLRELRVEVVCPAAEEPYDGHIVARLRVDHLLWGDAMLDRSSMFLTCDGDSAALAAVHEALTGPGGGDMFRRDLGIRYPVDAVVVIQAEVFHPAARLARVAVMDTIFNLAGRDSLGVTFSTVGTPSEHTRLGLARVPETAVMWRHNSSLTPYARQYPHGREVRVEGTAEMAARVREEWARRYGAWDEDDGG